MKDYCRKYSLDHHKFSKKERELITEINFLKAPYFDNEIFNFLPNLQTIIFERPLFKSMELNSNTIKRVCVVTGDLEEATIKSDSLGELKMQHNKLKKINLDCPKLSRLMVSNNELTNITIPDSVVVAYLAHNNINNVCGGKSLKDLDLNHNKIKVLDLESKQLFSLDLNNNPLERLNIKNDINILRINSTLKIEKSNTLLLELVKENQIDYTLIESSLMDSL